MDLAPETIKKFSESEIIAHCLYEMTFTDFDEKAIQEQFKTLNDPAEENKKPNGKRKKGTRISLDEIKRRLNEIKGSSQKPSAPGSLRSRMEI